MGLFKLSAQPYEAGVTIPISQTGKLKHREVQGAGWGRGEGGKNLVETRSKAQVKEHRRRGKNTERHPCSLGPPRQLGRW